MNNAILIIWIVGHALTSQPVPVDQCKHMAQQAEGAGNWAATIHATCIYPKTPEAPHAQ